MVITVQFHLMSVLTVLKAHTVKDMVIVITQMNVMQDGIVLVVLIALIQPLMVESVNRDIIAQGVSSRIIFFNLTIFFLMYKW